MLWRVKDFLPFKGRITFHCIYTHHILFIHSSTGGHLSCFHLLAEIIVNNAAVTMDVQISFWNPGFHLFGYVPSSGIDGLLSFFKNLLSDIVLLEQHGLFTSPTRENSYLFEETVFYFSKKIHKVENLGQLQLSGEGGKDKIAHSEIQVIVLYESLNKVPASSGASLVSLQLPSKKCWKRLRNCLSLSLWNLLKYGLGITWL